MGCEQYKESLAGAALGMLSPEREVGLRTHLGSCAACRAALEEQQHLLAAIDRGIAASVAAEPSLGFAARVHTQLAEERLPASRWFSGWVPVAASALAVLALVAVWFARREPGSRRPDGSARNAQSQKHAESMRAVPAESAPLRSLTSRRAEEALASRSMAPGRKIGRHVAVRAAEPEVLVPPGQREAILRLYESVQGGRVDSASLLAQPGPLKPVELKIPLLEIRELHVESKLLEPGRER